MENEFRSGFIAIIGRPNVGKSTLMNALIGEKVAIVSDKPQTTRNKIQGILTRPSYQMIFIDTPGIHKPKNKLSEYMMKSAQSALEDVDAVVMVVDGYGGIGRGDRAILEQMIGIKTPLIIAVNKIDTIDKDKLDMILKELTEMEAVDEVIPISALHGTGINELEEIMTRYLTYGPKYFPDDMVTDQPERVIIAEIIREKALELLRDEVPHGIGVEIDKIRERKNQDILEVYATIYCERNSHKGIIIGSKGQMLKEIGQRSRVDIERLLGSRIYLELWVKVKEDWRNSMSTLRTLGYD